MRHSRLTRHPRLLSLVLLASLLLPAGPFIALGVHERVLHYRYDGEGKRIESRVESTVLGQQQTVTKYPYDAAMQRHDNHAPRPRP